jgi:biopolymer transport protein ExbD
VKRRASIDTPEIQIAPMIDCVFLMLVYFMTTSSLEKSEADLVFPAGQAGIVSDPLHSVDEQLLEINQQGEVEWNGSLFPLLENNSNTSSLVDRLRAFRDTCITAGSEPSLRLLPMDTTPHQAIVTLLDSISESGIEMIHFP